MSIINNNIEDELIINKYLTGLFNRTYLSYISKVKPIYFLHTLLNKITTMIDGNYGMIMTYDYSNDLQKEKINIIAHTIGPKISGSKTSNNTESSEWNIILKYIQDNNKLGKNSLIKECIDKKCVKICEKYSYRDVLGIEYKTYNNVINANKLMIVPIIFGNKTNGIMLLSANNINNANNLWCRVFNRFGIMMGTLIENINVDPQHELDKSKNREFDNKKEYVDPSMTYQLMTDINKISNDIIVVIDCDARIIYKNDNFINMIRSENEENDKNKSLLDIIPKSICLLSNTSETCYYKNKKIEFTFQNKSIVMEMIVNSITSCGTVYHIIKIIEKDMNNITTNGKNTNSRNLVAYLSHELRNPIQAISTGVYIIDRYVKKKNIFNKPDTPIGNNKKIDFGFSSVKQSLLPESILDNKYVKSPENNKYDDKIKKRSYIDLTDPQISLSGTNNNDNSPVEKDRQSNESLSDSVSDLSDSTDLSDIDEHDDNTVIRKVIKRVTNSCKNMKIIIDDILDLSKIDNNEFVMNLDESDLKEITDLIYEESKNEADKKGLILEYIFDVNVPEHIYTDNTRLFQIITNLISNSIKYSNTGSILFKVDYDQKNNNVVFQVSDQGQGIRREEIPNLFKEYGRTSNSISEVNSTGLGLYVCQKIAGLLGGYIDVVSEFKKGSTFTFHHPVKIGQASSCIEIEPFNEKKYKSIKGNILIVDDDKNIISLFKLLLKCMNYDKGFDIEIDTAITGDKAIELCKNKYYDLIFMDIDLDGNDGCVITESIINLYKNKIKSPLQSIHSIQSVVIAVTANIKSIQPDRDIKFNVFDDIIIKPFNNKDIEKCIVKYLNK